VARSQPATRTDRKHQNDDFSVVKIVSYFSRFMILMPGDIITTGTPLIVGMGMKPPCYLKRGDELALWASPDSMNSIRK
jgi:2-keto-4-pentenoate hydratase/2-oxohepta-3-ene-1,7-dioic acid hydratase in catechol pathway